MINYATLIYIPNIVIFFNKEDVILPLTKQRTHFMALLKYQCFYLIKDKIDLLFRIYFEFAYVIYCFFYLVSGQMQNAITEAVQIYNDLTCVRFVPRNQASGLPHASYLYLTRGYGQSKSVVFSSILF